MGEIKKSIQIHKKMKNFPAFGTPTLEVYNIALRSQVKFLTCNLTALSDINSDWVLGRGEEVCSYQEITKNVSFMNNFMKKANRAETSSESSDSERPRQA